MDTTKFIDPNTVSEFLKSHYDNGETVSLKFQKRDGSLRGMVVQKNAELLSTIQGVRSHYNAMTKVVTEKIADGTFQFRSIPLDRVLEIDLA